MNASCAADLIRSPGPGKGTHFHPLATRVNERFDPTPPSPASDLGPILPKVPSHPAPHETAETAGSTPANHRSEEHSSELQSQISISYAVLCLQKLNTHCN